MFNTFKNLLYLKENQLTMKKNILFIFLFFTFLSFSQNTYTVDNRTGSIADYTDLQTAIDKVPVESILIVHGSTTSYGSINISKKIIIKGTGYFLDENSKTQSNVNSSKLGGVYFRAGASGAIITGLDIEPVIIYDEVSNVSILRNRIKYIKDENEKGTNILVSNNFIYSSFKTNPNSSATSTGILLSDSKITGNIIISRVTGRRLELTNNILSGNVIHGNYMYNSIIKNNVYKTGLYDSSASFSNTIKNNIIKSTVDQTGSDGNIYKSSIDNLFINSTDSRYTSDGRYILKNGSIAIGAGENGVDVGPFGGGYKLSGIPDIPNIYEFIVPTTGYTNDGIQVKVKIKSNN